MKKLLALILAVILTITMFTSCAATDQALVSMYLNMGEKYLLDLNYEEAIVYFNKVIEVEPRNARAYMGAAEAYVGLGDTESAIELLKTALGVFSDDEEVTIELLEMLIEIDPTNPEWYTTLADIYEGREDIDSAVGVLSSGSESVTDSESLITILERLIALDPSQADWYIRLAQVHIDMGNRGLAISTLRSGMNSVGDAKTRLYDKLIEIDSGNTQWYFELANVYEDSDNIASAVDTLELGLNSFEEDTTKINFSEELIEIDETNAEWYLTIAYIYIDQPDIDSAIAILRQGLEKASDTTEIEALLEQLSPDLTGFVTTSYYYYDEDGNLTSSYERSSDGDTSIETGSGVYDNGTAYTYTTTTEYGSSGQQAKSTMKCTDSNGDPYTYTHTFEYDSDGNMTKHIEKYVHSSGETRTETYTYVYDSNGNKISGTETVIDNYTYNNSTTTYEYGYTYDSDGNLITEIRRNTDGSYYYKTEHEYNSHGDVSKETITRRYSSSDTSTYWIDYTYEYDSDGYATKTVENYSDSNTSGFDDSDGEFHVLSSFTTEYDYNEETMTSTSTFTWRSTDGTVEVESHEYTHDATGKSVSRTETIDGVTTKYVCEYEYEYGSDGRVEKCVITWYYASSGNVSSITTMERAE